ncbi:MAG: 23S rRNA (guanosine(2251)-2'-O)-methyltransferase RlmB [Alphaproteobacteria bacterium]|nr:23S rRNA (guanosine(2251)-2'-O)-methyltransferase RlmB [Alphaproteobacteria bacterium]
MKQQGPKGRGRGRNQGSSSQQGGGRGRDRDDRRGGKGPEKQGKPPRQGGRDDGRGGNRPPRGGADRPHDRSRNESRGDNFHDRSPDQPRSGGGRGTLWGTHAVRAAWLNPARNIRGLFGTEEALESFADTLAEARDDGLDRPKPTVVDRRALDRMTGMGAVHQGLALDTAPLEDVSVQDLINIAANRERSVIVMLDQVTDPHNVGAIMRSACAFDAVGIVMQKRHAPELDGVLVKTASGAAEHIPVAYETNLSRTLEVLQEDGFFALALDERGEISLEDLPAYAKAVIVMGAEGPGIRRLVKEHCDRLVRLPTDGPMGVLNVSNATAVALYAITTAKKK